MRILGLVDEVARADTATANELLFRISVMQRVMLALELVLSYDTKQFEKFGTLRLYGIHGEKSSCKNYTTLFWSAGTNSICHKFYSAV